VEERCYFVGYRWEVEIDLLHGGGHAIKLEMK
jgi:hypothetical protein